MSNISTISNIELLNLQLSADLVILRPVFRQFTWSSIMLPRVDGQTQRQRCVSKFWGFTMSFGKKSFARAALNVIGAVSAFACAAPALALETGCQDATVVRAALQEEGQFVIVNGVRHVPGNPRNIFTSNADGSLGYSIEGADGTQLCIRARYTDIRVNGNTDGPTPSWALRGANTAHDQWLASVGASRGEKVLMGARVLRRNESGEEVRGAFMMVTRGNVLDSTTGQMRSAGGVTITLNSGEIRPSLLLGNVEKVQPNYDRFAQRSTQLAALNH